MIDTVYDFRSDSNGKDPDKYSATLRRYHQLLWSKPLPDGSPFDLDTITPDAYLHHASNLGEFVLTSDSFIPSYAGWSRKQALLNEVGWERVDAFRTLAYTIGGMIVFPGNRVGRFQSINGARGFNTAIADRMDLTLECIRLHYAGAPSPLEAVLGRYRDFFDLFTDFAGYLEFFLLQDLVEGDKIRFFLPSDGFTRPASPLDVDSYEEYMNQSMAFVQARNERISRWATSQPA